MISKLIYAMSIFWIGVGLVNFVYGNPLFGGFCILCGALAIGFESGWFG